MTHGMTIRLKSNLKCSPFAQKAKGFLTLAVSAAFASACFAQTHLYVSKAGRDSWSGTLSAPNVTNTDGPKLTIGAARDTLRNMRALGTLSSKGAIVDVAPGHYFQPVPLTFLSLDRATSTGPMLYNSTVPKGAVIDGGIQVKNWLPLDPRLAPRVNPAVAPYLVCADLKALGVTDFGVFPKGTWTGNCPSTAIELFVNNQRQTVARWPNTGYATVSQGIDSYSFTADLSTANFNTSDTDLVICGFPSHFDWAYTSDYGTVNTAASSLTFAHAQVYPSLPGGRFYVKNALSELDTPGEYYVDKATGLLVYYPTGNMANATAYVSVNSGGPVVKLTDQQNMTFQNFTVEHGRNDGVMLQRCQNVKFVGGQIDNCGGSAVVIQELGGTPGCSNNNVIQSVTMNDLGEYGVYVYAGNRLTLVPANNVVKNNSITRFGRIMPTSRSGVMLWGVGNQALHNNISECPSTALQLFGNDNIADSNHVWNACTDTNDAGGIYLSGTDASQRGNVVRNNYVENVYARMPGTNGIWGIYLDGRASGVTVTGNVVRNSNTGYLINAGRDNLLQNNVAVDCNLGIQVDEASHSSWSTLTTSLNAVNYLANPYAGKYPRLPIILNTDPTWPEGNICNLNGILRATKDRLCRSLYGVHFDPTVTGARDSIAWMNSDWESTPMFVDEANGNFTPLAGSRLALAGFKAIAANTAGVATDPYITGNATMSLFNFSQP